MPKRTGQARAHDQHDDGPDDRQDDLRLNTLALARRRSAATRAEGQNCTKSCARHGKRTERVSQRLSCVRQSLATASSSLNGLRSTVLSRSKWVRAASAGGAARLCRGFRCSAHELPSELRSPESASQPIRTHRQRDYRETALRDRCVIDARDRTGSNRVDRASHRWFASCKSRGRSE